MSLQKLLLKVMALSIFVIFIVAFISYYNKPAAGNKALALNVVNDTTGKLTADSLKSLRRIMSSSKSIILVDEKRLPVRSFSTKKDTGWHIRMDTTMPVKKDSVKMFIRPKQ